MLARVPFAASQVEALLLKHDPQKANLAATMLAKYRGREQVLLDSLRRKFESKEVCKSMPLRTDEYRLVDVALKSYLQCMYLFLLRLFCLLLFFLPIFLPTTCFRIPIANAQATATGKIWVVCGVQR